MYEAVTRSFVSALSSAADVSRPVELSALFRVHLERRCDAAERSTSCSAGFAGGASVGTCAQSSVKGGDPHLGGGGAVSHKGRDDVSRPFSYTEKTQERNKPALFY